MKNKSINQINPIKKNYKGEFQIQFDDYYNLLCINII